MIQEPAGQPGYVMYAPQPVRRPGFPVWALVVVVGVIFVTLVAGAGAAVWLLTGGAGGGSALSAGTTALQKARDTCGGAGIVVADEGRTLTIDTQGEDEYTGASFTQAECVFTAIEMPTSVHAKVGNTRAMDGMVSADWDGYSASWNYHPDTGMNMVITGD
jgi:hypothetical protein